MDRSVPTLRFIKTSSPSSPRAKPIAGGRIDIPFPPGAGWFQGCCDHRSVSYWHNHGWRQVELADAPSKTTVI